MGAAGLALDLYHLDSAYVAWRAGIEDEATFDLYVRTAPFGGSFLLVAGLDEALAHTAAFRFTDEDLAFVAGARAYDRAFLDVLRAHRFTGEVLAMPEGTVAFPAEPLLRVTAPFREALLLESGLLNAINRAALVATKAARVVLAAGGRPVAEFGLRRAPAPDVSARAAWIAGCASTSYVGAARALGIPSSGTIPHALVQAFPTEEEAFRAVAESLDPYTLLLDTYDVRRAVQTVAEVARKVLAETGHALAAVRLDSGDIADDARYCRRVLDEAGLGDTQILASGDLDEARVEELVRSGAPIDAFGVGTSIATGAPDGALTCVYKLVWYAGRGDPAAIKHAGEKSTWPGRKQVWRVGTFEGDVVSLEDEPAPAGGVALLEPAAIRSLNEVRERAVASLAAMPERFRRLGDPEPYPVTISAGVVSLRERALRARGLA